MLVSSSQDAAKFYFPQKFDPNFPVGSLPSAIMGHCLHCLRGYHPGVSMLLLHLQKMDIQEEKQKEGQRQGQKCYQHEGRQGWSQNRGKDFELLLLKIQKHVLPYMLI